MTRQATQTAVQASIVVEAPIERAFSVFTDGMGTWWPPEHHLAQAEVAEMVFEPRAGGQVYDRAVDGSECHWGRVIVYEPPQRLVMGWHVSAQWQLETDPHKTSEVEVRFVAEGAARTRVEVEHRHLDRHGEGWEQTAGGRGAKGLIAGVRLRRHTWPRLRRPSGPPGRGAYCTCSQPRLGGLPASIA